MFSARVIDFDEIERIGRKERIAPEFGVAPRAIEKNTMRQRRQPPENRLGLRRRPQLFDDGERFFNRRR